MADKPELPICPLGSYVHTLKTWTFSPINLSHVSLIISPAGRTWKNRRNSPDIINKKTEEKKLGGIGRQCQHGHWLGKNEN